MRIQSGDNLGIGGFIITGTAPKRVLIRVLGPSLSSFALTDLLPDPRVELHGPSGFATIMNDDWGDDPVQKTQIESTGLAPTNELESAIDVTLTPGSYTALAKGKGDASGLGVVEVYDLSQDVPARLANISTRAFAGTGNSIIIAGFTLGGHSGPDRVVVRGLGPSLSSAGVPNALANPRLELRNAQGVVLIANDNWQDDPAQKAEISAAQLAPTNESEAAIIQTLGAGAYTALLSGTNNTTGVGLVEVYDLGP